MRNLLLISILSLSGCALLDRAENSPVATMFITGQIIEYYTGAQRVERAKEVISFADRSIVALDASQATTPKELIALVRSKLDLTGLEPSYRILINAQFVSTQARLEKRIAGQINLGQVPDDVKSSLKVILTNTKIMAEGYLK